VSYPDVGVSSLICALLPTSTAHTSTAFGDSLLGLRSVAPAATDGSRCINRVMTDGRHDEFRSLSSARLVHQAAASAPSGGVVVAAAVVVVEITRYAKRPSVSRSVRRRRRVRIGPRLLLLLLLLPRFSMSALRIHRRRSTVATLSKCRMG
jgi:hypothetical protein